MTKWEIEDQASDSIIRFKFVKALHPYCIMKSVFD